jgi:hypothetical protein
MVALWRDTAILFPFMKQEYKKINKCSLNFLWHNGIVGTSCYANVINICRQELLSDLLKRYVCKNMSFLKIKCVVFILP